MNEILESSTSYAVAVVTIGAAAVLDNASTIMTVGGLVLLALRLYVDGKRAVQKWSE
ncbi:hypothetical protein ZHAWSFBX_CDS_0064 [Agrobacterium phage Alfirin]|nr:hypothetical protein ZHAWSFBX_CDS_0064 [Agrobacterium phage Alfirin]